MVNAVMRQDGASALIGELVIKLGHFFLYFRLINSQQ